VCLIFVAHRAIPQFPLVVAANRDEYHDRPTAPAEFWRDEPGLLAGRDLRAGGTWLGVTRAGRFAALTNFRHGMDQDPEAPSRGDLIRAVLTDSGSLREGITAIAAQGARYNGFSLLAGDTEVLYFYSNRGGGVCEVTPGVHGLSNDLLDTPWPKVTRGKERFVRQLSQPGVPIDALLEMMADGSEAEAAVLPDSGIPGDRERRLSAMFIRADTYGTRSTTVVRMAAGGRTEFTERTFDRGGVALGTVTRAFSIAGPAPGDDG